MTGFRYRGLGLLLQSFAVLLLAALLCPLRAPAATPGPDDVPMLKLVAFGDSLTAGFLLPAEAAFPAVLERALRAEGYRVTIVNAGVSGDTATGGLSRLDWALAEGADGVILELGGNDMLRGTDPEVTKAALDTILFHLHSRGIKVLIAGMKASSNLGTDYKKRFDAIYPELAAKYDATLYPFFLDGVLSDPRLRLSDGLHPNEAGIELMVERMLPTVRSFLRRFGEKPAASR